MDGHPSLWKHEKHVLLVEVSVIKIFSTSYERIPMFFLGGFGLWAAFASSGFLLVL